MQQKLKPDWICIRTHTPRPESGHYPDPTEALDCIYRLGEEAIKHFQKR